MALHRLPEMPIGVPGTAQLDTSNRKIGFVGGSGCRGSVDRPGRISLAEALCRQLRGLRIACEDESDLAAAAARLEALGVAGSMADGRLTVVDPVNR